ncbi:MAG: hypothetical protein AB1489_01975 [Acidobacteriota bacterium]
MLQITDSSVKLRAFGAVLFAVVVFSGEAVTLRTAAKYGVPMGPIAVAQCAVAALVQLAFGGRFAHVDWRRWWPALLTSCCNGLAFYLVVRVAPAALVGLIEPLSLAPLMLGHRLLLHKPLTIGCTLALTLLIVASVTAVGQWPEEVGWLAIGFSTIGIFCSGLALVTGEAVPIQGLASFVLAMQSILMVFSAIVGLSVEFTSLAGQEGRLLSALAVGATTGLFVSLAVMALYYGVTNLGALRVGSIKMLRLPTIAVLAYFVVQEHASLTSALALGAVVFFSILAVRLSVHEDLSA